VAESKNLAQDMQDTSLVVQVVDATIFEGEKAKKNIKGRVTLSDGVSKVICMLPEKTHKLMTAQGEDVRKYDIWVLDPSKQQCSIVSNKPVIVLRSAPQVYGQHLTSEIGAPQDYTKNKDSDSFPDSYDLRVPGAERASTDN